MDVIARWKQVAEAQDAPGLHDLLAEEAVFHSPVVHTPQRGRAITGQYLNAAFHVLFNDNFRYVGEWRAERSAVLEFLTQIEGVVVDGVDIISWNEEGRIVEFKVMVRPLKAIDALRAKMAQRLTG